MGESRRAFLKKLLFASEPAALSGGESNVLVSVFLRGGADTLNMLVPYGDHDYYKVRPTIAIAAPGKGKNAALKLDDFYGLHPALSGFYPIFSAGELAFIQAVGTDNPSGSHFEAQDQMEHGEAYGKPMRGGWLGRYLQCRACGETKPLSAVAIGLAVPESFRGAPASSVIRKIEDINVDSGTASAEKICRALSSMYQGSQAGVLANAGQNTLDLLKRVERMRNQNYKAANGANYANDDFSNGLKEIARLIKSDVGLEVACIDLNGWDTHFVQGGAEGQQAALIKELGTGISAFYTDLGKLRKKVTVVVMTEFGRRIYENGSLGTDHGRGFAFMAMGAGVKGGKIYGKYPGLKDDQYELGPGGMQIGVDYRNLLSEVLLYHGVKPDKIFPDLNYQRTGFMSV